LKGHDFSRAVKKHQNRWALQAAEKLVSVKGTGFTGCGKLVALKGHGFSRAVNAVKSMRASAPEGCFHCSYLKSGLFPQPV
jgi:hypothetical protein